MRYSKAEVRQIQQALNARGAGLKVDGIAGAKTNAAIQKFGMPPGFGSSKGSTTAASSQGPRTGANTGGGSSGSYSHTTSQSYRGEDGNMYTNVYYDGVYQGRLTVGDSIPEKVFITHANANEATRGSQHLRAAANAAVQMILTYAMDSSMGNSTHSIGDIPYVGDGLEALLSTSLTKYPLDAQQVNLYGISPNNHYEPVVYPGDNFIFDRKKPYPNK